MAVNKVVYNGNVLVDLTPSTNTPETMLHGTQALDASGNLIEGSLLAIKSIEQSADSEDAERSVTFTLTNNETQTITLRNGRDGVDGAKGEVGPEGPKGEPGMDGKDGAQGPEGPQGNPGEKGEKGDKGDPGADGSPGEKGEKGDKGDPGADGYTPQKGIDYYTETDKQELVNAVLAAIPSVEEATF